MAVTKKPVSSEDAEEFYSKLFHKYIIPSMLFSDLLFSSGSIF